MTYEQMFSGINCILKNVSCYFLFVLAASNPQYCEGSSFGEVPNGQWMTQSFADQIPEFSAGMTQEEEGSSA